MFGIDDLLVGGLIASLAGSAMSYGANASASKATERARLDAYRRQQDLARQAEKQALDVADDYRIEKRMDAQNKIQERLEQEFVAPAMEAQAITQDAATTQGDVSNDYVKAKAASDANVAQTSRNLARLMAKAGSASQLRRNEAYKYANAASNIGLLQNFSRGQGAVDEMKISEAANSGAGGNFLGNIISSLGMAGVTAGLGNMGLDALYNKEMKGILDGVSGGRMQQTFIGLMKP